MPGSWAGEGLSKGPFIIHPPSPPPLMMWGWGWGGGGGGRFSGITWFSGGNGGGSVVANRVKGGDYRKLTAN